MGNGQRLSFWGKVPIHRDHPGFKLLLFLGKLFDTHGKEITVWKTAEPGLGLSKEYIAKIEVHSKGKYDLE